MPRKRRKKENPYTKEWKENLCSNINDEIMKNIDNINLFVCANIALECLDGIDRYYEDHSNDPPYDCSGELKEAGQIEVSELKNITFSEFCRMYDGSTVPSFYSGCGFFHQEYSDDVDEWITDAAFIIQGDIIQQELGALQPELLADEDAMQNALDDVQEEIDGDTLAWEAYDLINYLSVKNEDWTLDAIRDKGLFYAMRIEKNRENYARKERDRIESLEARAASIDLKSGFPLVSFFDPQRAPYITKDDKVALEWLKTNYSSEEIELLIIGGKIRVSNSLDFQYHSVRNNSKTIIPKEEPLRLNFSMFYNNIC